MATAQTYTLVDPKGKALSTTYSASDKAQMEKMGLAAGYKFVPTPTSSSGSSSSSGSKSSSSSGSSSGSSSSGSSSSGSSSSGSSSSGGSSSGSTKSSKTTNTAPQTYTLLDPSGKVLSTTYSAEDKAQMERMGLVSGYKFVPTGSQISGNSSSGATGASKPSTTTSPAGSSTGKAVQETTTGTNGTVYVAKIPVQTSAGTEYYRITQDQVNKLWASDPAMAEKYGLPEPTQTAASPTVPTKEQPQSTAAQGGDEYEYDNSAIFMGNETLVTFTGSPQVWLVNKEEKTIRPFASTQAFNNAFGDNAAAALMIANNQVISDADLAPFGAFEGYTVLDGQYAIKEDGTSLKYDNSKQAMKARYGNEINTDGEMKAYMMLDGFMDLLVADKSGIDANTINKIKNDESKVAFYINALAYGGYGLADVYRDLKRQELINKGGSSELNNISPISASQTRSMYANTDDGQEAYQNVKISPPSDLVGMNLATLNLPIYNMPDEAFKTLVPLLDWNSDEFKSKMDEVQSAYHDVVMQQLSAQTEHDKALADYNWNRFKEEVARTYGIQLSDNAYEAWNQLEQARDTFSQRGVVGSGLEAESVDDYLRRVRTIDQRSRDEREIKETTEEANHYLAYGTPAQIQALINEDKAKGLPQSEWRATKWGLIPSPEVKAGLSYEALKQKYPKMSDEEITRYISSVLDENGNYRSTLYQNYMTNKLAEEDKFRQYQMDTVLQQELQKEEDAYKQFTKPDSPFLRTEGDPLNPELDAVKLKMPSGMQVQETYKNLSTPSPLSGGTNIVGQPADKYGTGTPTQPASTATVVQPAAKTSGSSSATLFRDSAGNILNASGKQVVSAAEVSKLSPEMQQNLLKNVTAYTPVKSTTVTPSTTKTTSGTTSKPTVSTGTTTQSSKVTMKSPTGGTMQVNSSDLTPDKKAALTSRGYTFI